MNIKSFLTGLKYKLGLRDDNFVRSTLCGVDLVTVTGTIREHADQDDAWFFYLAKHHDVIFDIGANIGYTALLAMIQNPDRSYVLVDPNPNALSIAQQNLLHNNLGFRAQFFTGFVSESQNKELKFYTIGVGAAGSIHADHAKSASAINSYKMVKTTTLDFLFSYYSLEPDLVKIDVEGAETLVMDGAKGLAKATQCTFFIEMHAVKDLPMETGGKHIIQLCQQMDYKVWYMKTGEELINASRIKDRGKCHLLLLPKSKPYPDYLKSVPQNAPLPKSI